MDADFSSAAKADVLGEGEKPWVGVDTGVGDKETSGVCVGRGVQLNGRISKRSHPE